MLRQRDISIASTFDQVDRALNGTATLVAPTATDMELIDILYLAESRLHLDQMGGFDESAVKRHFEQQFLLSEARVIRRAGTHAGWMQIGLTSAALRLKQLHLLPEERNRGVGSTIMQGLIDVAQNAKIDLELAVLHSNSRALHFYRRLGFAIIGSNDRRLELRLSFDTKPPPP